MIIIDLVVTRHAGLLEYLKEIGLAGSETIVMSHAYPADIMGKNVCGVLPHNLSCLCETFTEIPLNLPSELRGKELSIEELRQFAAAPVTYKVTKI